MVHCKQPAGSLAKLGPCKQHISACLNVWPAYDHRHSQQGKSALPRSMLTAGVISTQHDICKLPEGLCCMPLLCK